MSTIQLYSHSCAKGRDYKGRLITDNSRGEVLCQDCGLILKERTVDTGFERVARSKEEFMNRTRTGDSTKLSIHDQGVSAKIGSLDFDATGRKLSPFTKSRFNRLRTWDTRSKKRNKDRSMARAFILLETMKSKMGLSEVVVESAAYLYRKAAQKNLIRGRTVSTMLLSCLYSACRESGTPRSLSEIAKVGNVRKKVLQRAIRTLMKNLDLKLNPHDPTDFLSKVASEVGVGEKTKRVAQSIIESAKKHGIATSKNPLSITGSALYLSAAINNENVSYTKLSRPTGVSTVTLRKHVLLLVSKLKDEPYLKSATRFLKE